MKTNKYFLIFCLIIFSIKGHALIIDEKIYSKYDLIFENNTLSRSDTVNYQKIFESQEECNWKKANKHIFLLSDRVLMGHVLSQRYLHPRCYRSEFIELTNWLKKYNDHPQARKIYIFSRVKEDKPLDRFKNLERVDLDEFIQNKPQIEEYKDGILIFDDIDTILNKLLVKVLRNFRDDILECGRHYGITCISTSHIIMNFGATRTLINEAQAVVLFPRGSSFQQVKGFLDRYLGFSNYDIDIIKNLPTRWIFIWKEYPKYLIYEKGVMLW